MAVQRFGDWNKAKRLLSRQRFLIVSRALHQATVKSALLLVREIKLGIRNQEPGGKPFAKLAESTIAKKGSSKALIDSGFLVNSITQRILKDQAFVGILRGTTNRDGDDLVNIGAVMEHGATIRHPSGATIIIPPRPFLHPVMEKHRDMIIQTFQDALFMYVHT